MVASVRPIFRDGERLTARRLNEAVEYLRTVLRRTLLAPLGPGAAVGLRLGASASGAELVIAPGVAIDGKGHVLVLAEERRFTVAAVLAAIGNPEPGGQRVRVRLALDATAPDPCFVTDPCAPSRPASVRENVRVLFEAAEAVPSLVGPGHRPHVVEPCVDPWGPLDVPAPEASCGVTLGYVTVVNASQLVASDLERQGVVPKVSGLQSSFGTPSLFLGPVRFTPGNGVFPDATAVDEDGMTVPVATVFTGRPLAVLPPGPATFVAPARFAELTGKSVQATHLGKYREHATARLSPTDHRVLEACGGVAGETEPVAPGLGGTVAVVCAVASGQTIERAGIPLKVTDNSAPSATVEVERATDTGEALIGLSAGPSYQILVGEAPFLFPRTVVPVATSGLVRVKVDRPNGGGDIPPCEPMTLSNGITGTLTKAETGEMVLAQLAQRVPENLGPPDTMEVYAWVVHPPRAKV